VSKSLGTSQTLSKYLYRHKMDVFHDQEQQQQQGEHDQQWHLDSDRDISSWQQQQWQLTDAGEDQQHEYTPDLGPLPPLLPLNLDSNHEEPTRTSAAAEQQNSMDLTLTPAKPQGAAQSLDAALVATLSPLVHQALASSLMYVTGSSHHSSARQKRLRLSLADSAACPPRSAAADSTPASPSAAAFTPLDVATTTPGKLFTSQGFGSPQGLGDAQGFTPGARTGPMNSPSQPPLGLFSRFESPLSPSDTEEAMAGGGGGGKEGEEEAVRRSSSGAAAAAGVEAGRQQQPACETAEVGGTCDNTISLGVWTGSHREFDSANSQQQQQQSISGQQYQLERPGKSRQEHQQQLPATTAPAAAWGCGWQEGVELEHEPGAGAEAVAEPVAAAEGAAVSAANRAGAAPQEEVFCVPSSSQAGAGRPRLSCDATSCQTRCLNTPTAWGKGSREAVTPSTIRDGAPTPTTAGVVTITPIIMPHGFVPNGAGTPLVGSSRVVGVTTVMRGSSGVLLERNCWDRVAPGRAAGVEGKGS
jgi:hypothetical protein